ncbi:cathepsin F [Chelydra serpentina]|uniref:Cathepsin F n=1 Tax=Chelydra serpentina TaxID=8475 RepID=A0A8T1TFB8_CHESE|nr:cathepsin F [Chelydra serpentina]
MGPGVLSPCLLLLWVWVCALPAGSVLPPELSKAEVTGMFKDFMIQFNRTYRNPAEQRRRFGIFTRSLLAARRMQETELGTGQYGVTRFSDWTDEEFRGMFWSPRPHHAPGPTAPKEEAAPVLRLEEGGGRDRREEPGREVPILLGLRCRGQHRVPLEHPLPPAPEPLGARGVGLQLVRSGVQRGLRVGRLHYGATQAWSDQRGCLPLHRETGDMPQPQGVWAGCLYPGLPDTTWR